MLVKLHYPDSFLYDVYGYQMRIKKSTQDDRNIFNLMVSSKFYSDPDSLIFDANANGTPQYVKSNLNGYEVITAQSKFTDNNPITYFTIPFGNRTLGIHYYTAQLSPTEKALADKMLASVHFYKVKEDTKDDYFESCKEFGNFFFD